MKNIIIIAILCLSNNLLFASNNFNKLRLCTATCTVTQVNEYGEIVAIVSTEATAQTCAKALELATAAQGITFDSGQQQSLKKNFNGKNLRSTYFNFQYQQSFGPNYKNQWQCAFG